MGPLPGHFRPTPAPLPAIPCCRSSAGAHSSREYTAGRIDLRLFAFVQTKGPKEQSISAPRRRNGSHQYPRSHFRVAFQKEQWHTPVDSQKEEA